MEIVFVLQVEAIDYETSLKAALERDGAEETFRVSCTAIVIYENYIQHILHSCPTRRWTISNRIRRMMPLRFLDLIDVQFLDPANFEFM